MAAARNMGGFHIGKLAETPGDVPASGENLIFLISQPRAGSTMLQKVLGAHPAIHTVSEPWVALYPLLALRESDLTADYNPVLARRAVNEFLQLLPEGEEAYWQALRRMLSDLYGRALTASGKTLFLDKTPRYYFIIRELRRVFPHARFVFLLRNPLGVISSVLKTWVKSGDPLQLRPFRHDLVSAPRLIAEGIPSCGRNAIVVRYEDLASNASEEIRRLCGRLEIPFYGQMIEYGATSGGERWSYGDQDTVYREDRPIREHASRWRSVLKQFPVWEAWARSYVDALGPDLLRELGYDYEELRADLPAPSGDWKTITESDAERGARTHADMERAVAVATHEQVRSATFEAIAEERLTELNRNEAERARVAAEAERRQEALRRAVLGIEEREQRIGRLQEIAEERLAAMQDRDREIRIRDERAAELESIAAERLAAMQAQTREITALEAAAAERLAAMQDRDQEIAARDERLAGLEATAAERLAAMQDRDREIAARDERLAGLEATAAERLAAMEARDREISARDERLAGLEATAAERLAAMEARDREVAARDERIAALQAAAAEGREAILAREQSIGSLQNELGTLRIELEHSLGAIAQEQERAVALQRDIEELKARVAKVESERNSLRAADEILARRIQEFEQEGLREYLGRWYRRR